MQRMIKRMVRGGVLVLLLVVVWWGVTSYWQRTPAAAPVHREEQAALSTNVTTVEQAAPSDSPLPTPGRRPRPTPAIFTMPELPPIAWSSPPPCALHPLSLAEWRQRHTREQADAPSRARLPLQRARQMSPFLAGLGNVDQLSARLLEEVGEDAEKGLRQAQLALWLNVTSGRLNRASEIQMTELPEVKSVHDLLDLLEAPTMDQDKGKVLHQTIESVLTGEAIINPVCAHFLIAQNGSDLQSVHWTASGITTDTLPLAEIREEGWTPGSFQVAPDSRKVAFHSSHYESGGPIYLYDLTTHKLMNLNLEIGLNLNGEKNEALTSMDQREWWQIIGWCPDGQHLLLGVEGQSIAFWVSILDRSYERIVLDPNAIGVNTSRSTMDLSPDGASFVYLNLNRNGAYRHELHLYDLGAKTSQVITQRPNDLARFHKPRISPTGDQVAFLVESGASAPDITYTLEVLDLKTQTSKELISGYFGRVEPVWSPDGTQIAFAWSAPEMKDFYPLFPEADEWLGNIWVVSVETGETRQATQIQGAARNPVWSPDGNLLTFLTHNGQFGATTLNNMHQPWQVSELFVERASYGALANLP